MFLENFNGVSYILDKDWVSNVDLQLFTDGAGGGSTPLACQNGCDVFFMGKWCYFQWPKKWHNSDILRDMTFLEMLPITINLRTFKTLSDFVDIEFRMETTAILT
jgi:hypothetical protein